MTTSRVYNTTKDPLTLVWLVADPWVLVGTYISSTMTMTLSNISNQELDTLVASLQGTIEEGRLKSNLLRKQERYEASEEVLQSLQPVQALLDRITKVWIEVTQLQQPVITISSKEYY